MTRTVRRWTAIAGVTGLTAAALATGNADLLALAAVALLITAAVLW